MMTLQSAVLALQHFWADRGCLLAQPYYSQVGAGTMNPATFLRVLGPEPWRVAYVEPSVRPDDGRFGENPNRMQQHYQFQVILKPDPGNPQEVYLESLLALGIDPARHDLRFVEDNWEAPALGAWGLGWEVWLDGQEITQFTYFQQAGGQPLNPVSVEITYGLERILMALQGVDHFRDVAWSESRTYGDVQLQAEQEHSHYYFEAADINRLKAMFDGFEAEAASALERGLVLPSYDYILKCSHTFNVLDTRGAIGVTERAALFGRMRDLSRRVAEAYVEQRRALGFPWLSEAATRPPVRSGAAEAAPGPAPEGPAPFLLEIGTEELPVADLEHALEQLRREVPAQLSEAGLTHGVVRVDGTPRRLAVQVEALAAERPGGTTRVKGPPEEQAFDATSQLTAAGSGWARKMGLSPDAETLRPLVLDFGGRRNLYYDKPEPPEPASHLLRERVLPNLLAGLTFDRSMRWNETDVAFSRPIRWLVVLHGDRVVPFSFAGVEAGRTMRGLRFRDPDVTSLPSASAYGQAVAAHQIIIDPLDRRDRIRRRAAELAGEVDGTVPPDDELLAEVADLVEAPAPLLGSFDESHLELPEPVLVAVMKKHQRYLPVRGKDGRLLRYFVAVANGEHASLQDVRKGNEQVIRARFADAAYFIRRDLERPLRAYIPDLARIAFQARLGSMLDKVRRIERLTAYIVQALDLTEAERVSAQQAAELCKADLATSMVVEMTSLQGEMGRTYALRSGESEAVAQALFEHHLPRFAGDALPGSRVGLAVGLADRLDTLLGLFGVGLQPTGARDPFGLRRAAIGLIQCLVGFQQRFDLRSALEQARPLFHPLTIPPEALDGCLEFLAGRQEALLLSDGKPHDVVQAVLAFQGNDPAGARLAVEALEAAVREPEWPTTLQAFARCARILRSVAPPSKGSRRLSEPAEKALDEDLRKAESATRRRGSVADFLAVFRPLIPAITTFFEDVLVMSEQPAEREARLSLLGRVIALAEGVADLSRLEGF